MVHTKSLKKAGASNSVSIILMKKYIIYFTGVEYIRIYHKCPYRIDNSHTKGQNLFMVTNENFEYEYPISMHK